MYLDPSTGTARLEYHARLLGHLANPKRMQACILLSRQELNVGSLSMLLDLRQSATSQHLARLCEDGIVQYRAERQFRYYSCTHIGTLLIIEAVEAIVSNNIHSKGVIL